MTGLPRLHRIHIPYSPPDKTKGRKAAFAHMLSYLVFQAEHARIGLEISACLVVYFLLQFIFPWGSMGVPSGWSSLACWFTACGLLVAFDQFVLCRPMNALKRARHCDIEGRYEQALALLETIGPRSSSFIRFPKVRYHLERAQILTHAAQFEDVESELTFAKDAGLEQSDYHLARCVYFKAKSDIEAALKELQDAQLILGDNPFLIAEEGLLTLEATKDYREAKKLFKKALDVPNVVHLEGGILAMIISGYFEVTRLWTGQAEEAIEGLTYVINQLKSVSFYNREYRPYLAALVLERAYYYATHTEPDAAVLDVKAANELCAYPPIQRRTEDVKEELDWRYSIKL